MKKELTDKQQRVFDCISDYMDRHNTPPTVTELQSILDIKSIRSVSQYLDALEKKGYIFRGRGFRSIRVVSEQGSGVQNPPGVQLSFDIPILGTANAGEALVYGEQTTQGSISLSHSIIRGNKQHYFLVQIEGTSMNAFMVNGKIIEDKSYVLIHKKDTQMNEHDAYLVILNGCATVKKVKKEEHNLYLLPVSHDASHRPIIVTEEDDVMINGKVIDVFNFS